ncbi:MAG: hypothetical protein IAF38_19715, partial [Bacteroidia bacterium]|nr:hypothetical protein [Bacteroidia bacterium]
MEKEKKDLPTGKKNIFHKITRFLWKTVKYSFLLVLVLLISLIIAVQFPAFQTWAGKQASDYYSKELKTKVHIDKIQISFFTSVDLKGVYLEDLHKDTLLYGGDLSVKILDFSIKKKFLNINTISLDNINAKILMYENEKSFNFQFIADYFASTDTTIKKDSTAPFKLDYGKLILNNVNFTYADRNDTTQTTGMNFSDIKLAGLSGSIYDIKFAGDTIRMNLDDLSTREKSGFHLKQLTTLLKVSPSEIRADSLTLETGNTYLHGYLSFKQDSYDDFSDFVNKVYMKA